MKRRHKYSAQRTEVDGISFSSKAEARRYSELALLQKQGHIRELTLQPRYDLIVNGMKCGFYKADFRYLDNRSSQRIVEDVKGFRTETYNLKKKLVFALYGVEIQEIGKKGRAR